MRKAEGGIRNAEVGMRKTEDGGRETKDGTRIEAAGAERIKSEGGGHESGGGKAEDRRWRMERTRRATQKIKLRAESREGAGTKPGFQSRMSIDRVDIRESRMSTESAGIARRGPRRISRPQDFSRETLLSPKLR